ncbi:MAG: site-2 protease family protein, partial [archaeon]|nr:site-2 protease family protein [archaeon]
YLAIFNTIPIPALDGGQMFFLLIEAIRRKPLPEAPVQKIVFVSMLLLISVIVWVTVQDIQRIF